MNNLRVSDIEHIISNKFPQLSTTVRNFFREKYVNGYSYKFFYMESNIDISMFMGSPLRLIKEENIMITCYECGSFWIKNCTGKLDYYCISIRNDNYLYFESFIRNNSSTIFCIK